MLNAILSGVLLGLALVFSVGPVIFTVIKLRINYGIISAFYFISGVWLSDIAWVLSANLFGNLLRELILYKNIIGVCGGTFLTGLGVFYLFFKKFNPREAIDNEIKVTGGTHARLFITGFLINTLNPGVIALWFAAATKSVSNSFNERVMVFAICLSMNMLADIAKIYLAGKLKNKLNEKNIGVINKISGVLFLIFGAALIIGVLFKS